jgi:hypothetical protein
MLSDLVTQLVANLGEVVVVGQNVPSDRLVEECARQRPDLVFHDFEDGEVPVICERLLEELPSGVLVGLSRQGNQAFVSIGNVGSAQLMNTLLAASRLSQDHEY